MPKITAREIADYLESPLNGQDLEIRKPATTDHPEHNAVVFLKQCKPEILQSLASFDLLLLAPISCEQPVSNTVIYTDNPRLTFAKVARHFFEPESVSGIAPGAAVADNAVIGNNVSIGRYSVIEEGVTIGDHTEIRDHAVIRSGSVLGEGCLIKSGVIIGEEGFGFDFEEDGQPVRMPHTGGVRVGDAVEIGSNTVVCRGTIGDTVIEDHVKINDLVHIAHNCRIGRNTIIAGGKLSGSCKLGENVWMAPGALIRNKVTVGAGSTVGMGAVVVKDVEAGVVVYGNPAEIRV